MAEGPLNNPMVESLKTRASLMQAIAWARIAFGVPLCFVPPLVLGTMLWVAGSNLFGTWSAWAWYFWITAIVTIPLLFRLELRTNGDYLGHVARDPGPSVPGGEMFAVAAHLGLGRLAGVGATTLANPRMAASGITEILLAGPRMILNGKRHFDQLRVLKNVSLDRASLLLSQLMASSQARSLGELCQKGENRIDLIPVLCWLTLFGWIGVSGHSDKVILFSESRGKLGTAQRRGGADASDK